MLANKGPCSVNDNTPPGLHPQPIADLRPKVGEGIETKRADATSYRLFGLLHVADRVAQPVNMRPGQADPLDIYLRCAAFLAVSLRRHGMDFTLVTNRTGQLRQRAKELGLWPLVVAGHRFEWPVPPGIPFHSAHYKLDLIKAFGRGDFGDRVGLVDIDTVLIHPFPSGCMPSTGLSAYDITTQVEAEFGQSRIRADIRLVAGRPFESPRWFGGEWLLGDTTGFRMLAQLIARCWPAYVDALPALHHVGDEMIVSAALNLADAEGLLIEDAGRAGLVARWWTARTGFVQRPFREIERCAFLHLPSDKDVLAEAGLAQNDLDSFLAFYRRRAARKLLARRCYGAMKRLVQNDGRFVGTLR